jgi:hypothetical protein
MIRNWLSRGEAERGKCDGEVHIGVDEEGSSGLSTAFPAVFIAFKGLGRHRELSSVYNEENA